MSKSEKINLVNTEIRPLSNEISQEMKDYLHFQKRINDMFNKNANELLKIPKEYFGKIIDMTQIVRIYQQDFFKKDQED